MLICFLGAVKSVIATSLCKKKENKKHLLQKAKSRFNTQIEFEQYIFSFFLIFSDFFLKCHFLHKTAIEWAVSGICDCHISVQCMNLCGEV